MHILYQTSLLLLLSSWATLCIAQLDTRAPSALEGRAGNPVPLPLEQAFPFHVSETGPNQMRITWTPAPGHYLYRHMFHFSLQATAVTAPKVIDAILPDGLRKTDQFFGDIEAYYDVVHVDIVLPAATAPGAVLLLQYQGCADWGFCYPPQRREFPLYPTTTQ